MKGCTAFVHNCTCFVCLLYCCFVWLCQIAIIQSLQVSSSVQRWFEILIFLRDTGFPSSKKKKKWFLFCFLNSDHVFCSVQYSLNVDELAHDGCLVCTDLADEVGEGEAMGWGRPVTEGSTAEGLQSQVGQLVVHASPKLKNVQISLSVTGRTTHVEDIVQVFLLVTGGWLRL